MVDSSPPVLNYRGSVTREGVNMFNKYTTSGNETSLEIPGSDFGFFFESMVTKVTFSILNLTVFCSLIQKKNAIQ